MRPLRRFLKAAFLAFPLALIAADKQTSGDGLTERPLHFAAIPRASSVPILDGVLNDDCWTKAKTLDGFRLTAGKAGAKPRFATTARLVFDAGHLYIAVECLEPDPAGIKAPPRARDNPDIECDDRIEIFLDVGHDHRRYWHLSINAAGAVFDQSVFYRLHGSRTNEVHPEHDLIFKAKTQIGPDRWCAEIALDLAALGIDPLEDGATCGFNLGRARRPDFKKGDEISRRKPGPDSEYSAWAPVRDHLWETISNFHAPLEFGDIVFGDPGFSVEKISLRSARFTMGGIGNPSVFGDNPLEITLTSADKKPRELIASVTVESDSAAPVAKIERASFRPGQPCRLRYGIAAAGENHITITLSDALFGRVYYKTKYTEVAPPFADFDLGALYSRHTKADDAVRMRLVVAEEVPRSAEMRLDFVSPDGKPLHSLRIESLPKPGEAIPVFDLPELRKLPPGDYAIACTLADSETGRPIGSFTQYLTKPSFDFPPAFCLEQGAHSFGGIASEATKIRFPNGSAFVFWKAACNVPWWELDQFAVSNEFIEAWGKGAQGCAEPMQDRECRYSSVRVLENSPARIVLHWRYALADARYFIHAGEWVDEFYTFYPDGVGVREARLWARTDTEHEVMEFIPVKPPGVDAASMFTGPATSLTRLDGARWPVNERQRDLKQYASFVASDKDFIAQVHLKDRLHPFTIVSLREDRLPGVQASLVTLCRDPLGPAEHRGHWPAAQWPIDGYNAIGRHVPTHLGFGNIHAHVTREREPNAWLFLLGTAPEGSPLPLQQARSWLYPASIEVLGNTGTANGFDAAQRAFRITTNAEFNQTRLRFRYTPPPFSAADRSEEKAFRPILLLSTPKARSLKSIAVAGKTLDPSSYAFGRAASGETVLYFSAGVPYGAELSLSWK